MKLVEIQHKLLRALALAGALGGAWPIEAQVIEIQDNGEARIYGSEPGPAALPSKLSKNHPQDPFVMAEAVTRLDARLLRAVAWTESRGRQSAISPKGAIGVMQLMPRTAAELGVDASNAEANILGGATYLSRQIARFGSVSLGLAAYNAGPAAVERWRGVPPYAETRAYVQTIMGLWGRAEPGRVPSPASASKSPPPQALPVMLLEVSD